MSICRKFITIYGKNIKSFPVNKLNMIKVHDHGLSLKFVNVCGSDGGMYDITLPCDKNNAIVQHDKIIDFIQKDNLLNLKIHEDL